MTPMCIAASLAVSVSASGPPDPPADWPSFRGDHASGVSSDASTATTWDLETGENVVFRTPIPGLAHSSPVIAGDRLFVTAAVRDEGDAELKVGLYGSVQPVADEGEHKFKIYCLDKNTGEILWDRTAIEAEPAIKRHPKGSHAASSPATNGEVVVAFFASEGLYCYDVQGNKKWSANFGVLDSGFFRMKDAQWGFSSSPIIHDDVVIVQCDIQEGSFLAALDLETGEERWRTPRSDVPTWSTPTVHVADGRSQIICNGWKHIGGYDLNSGAELWKLEGGGDIPVPTPIVGSDLIYITNAHGRMAPIIAIKADATGTLELSDDDPNIAWHHARRGNYMQTPIIQGDLLFLCSDGGIVGCYEAKSGVEVFRERLGSGGAGFTASPVAADGKIYYTCEDGEVYVIRSGREFEIIAVNDMGTQCMASPAVSDGIIYWRTRTHVVAIGTD